MRLKIENEEQAKAAREWIEKTSDLHELLGGGLNGGFQMGNFTSNNVGNLQAALAAFEAGAEERAFGKIELSDVAQKRLAVICAMQKNADGHNELLVYGLEAPLNAPTSLAPTDKGRRYDKWFRNQAAQAQEKQAPVLYGNFANLEVFDVVTCDGMNHGTIVNIREQTVALVQWFGIESRSEVPFSDLKLIKKA